MQLGKFKIGCCIPFNGGRYNWANTIGYSETCTDFLKRDTHYFWSEGTQPYTLVSLFQNVHHPQHGLGMYLRIFLKAESKGHKSQIIVKQGAWFALYLATYYTAVTKRVPTHF